MVFLLVVKSLMIAGGTLLILALLRGRSAGDRSLIAHLGLAALAALPLGTILLPPLEVMNSYAPVLTEIGRARSATSSVTAVLAEPAPVLAASGSTADAVGWWLVLYAVPVFILLGQTTLALLRLVRLTARARTVTDSYWRTSLAQAQRRIGLRKGIALLASDDIASPISWGVLRPKILLNPGAMAARAEAGAILTHELAHVARWDWAKLVLSRVTVAIFWFNPFAWWLAREAHQLREEAADDAVLAANVDDAAYATLLVGAAREHGRRLPLGANGVAPGHRSLARRVQRVLDRNRERSSRGRRWAGAMALVATTFAVPLAALQFTGTAIASPIFAPPPPPLSGEEPLVVSLPGSVPVVVAEDPAAGAKPAPAQTPGSAPASAAAAPAGDERDVIRSVAVVGAERVEPVTIVGYTGLRPGQVFTHGLAQQALTELGRTRLFSEYTINFNDGAVLITVAENAAGPGAPGRFPQATIREVNIVGNEAFSDDRLQGELATHVGGYYDPDRLAFDQQKLRQFYLMNGYANVRVRSAVAALSADRRHFAVTYVIEEGQRQVG